MWLPLVLLALMASGSACPDLCECHQSDTGKGDASALSDVTCRGRVPGLSEIPAGARSLSVDSAEGPDVVVFLDELDATELVNDLGMLDAADNLRTTNDTSVTNDTSLEDATRAMPYLVEFAVTNCSLVSLNASWAGLERLRSLNLSCNNLVRIRDVTAIHTMNLSDLTRLDLSGNSLSEISDGSFRTLVALVRLNLCRNAIGTVDENAFRGLDRLESLDLSDNRLADLPDSALAPLYTLQKLDLSGNQLQVLGARWFESLDRLRELDISRNGLARAASGTLQPLSGLSVLRLAENPLKERDVSLLLGTGRRLETVDASRTGLARVPAALTRSVRALRLAGNRLTTIRSGDLDSYPLLRMLDIADNRLMDIENDALGRLEVLQELDLSGNVLSRIPGSLPSSLTMLKLQRNAITALKLDDLNGLYNLRSLMLNNNDINEIEVGALGQLPLLAELDLSDNPIKALSANTLSGPSNLAKLRMSGLTSLQRHQEEQSDMAFPVPTPERLTTLDVSRSPVLAGQLLADDAALSACKSLTELNLAATNISTVRSDLAYMLPQLRVFRLAGNEWNCTEDLYWLGEWIRQHRESNRHQRPARCSSPLRLAGLVLHELPAPPNSVGATASVTASVVLTREHTSHADEPNVTVSSNIDGANSDRDAAGPSAQSSANARIITDLPPTGTISGSAAPRKPRVYEAPTSFRNVTSSITRTRESQEPRRKSDETNRIWMDQNSVRHSVSSGSRAPSDLPSVTGTKESQSHDNRVSVRSREDNRPGKVGAKTAEPVNDTALEDHGARTIAQELNSRATDPGARLSESLSTGAHPGMMVLAGAVIGAVLALLVVLSRRTAVHRMDRYQRHENIEVHTLTPSAELW
ncbi:hypothetical protein HN011_009856 [Eciton burchellii]|nr:hypothetical protein HN011_009856 [Eciton burchellii]